MSESSIEKSLFIRTRRKALGAALALGIGLSLGSPGLAQEKDWPNRPIKVITPTSPGSSTDYFPRALGNYMQNKTGASIVVENRPGGSTIVGASAAKSTAPDGYSFFVGNVSSHSANPAVYTKLSYDPAQDFVEVGMFSIFPFLVLVRKDSEFQSIGDLVEYAKANPGKLTCGYSTVASRVPCELIKVRAGVDISAVPYKAAPSILQDLGGGFINFTVLDAMSSHVGIAGGLVRPIAITSLERSPKYPEVQTVAETLDGFEYEGWAGLSAPAGTPEPIIEKMSEYIREAIAEPEFRDTVERSGARIQAMTPAEQTAYVDKDRKRWKEWVKTANIPPID